MLRRRFMSLGFSLVMGRFFRFVFGVVVGLGLGWVVFGRFGVFCGSGGGVIRVDTIRRFISAPVSFRERLVVPSFSVGGLYGVFCDSVVRDTVWVRDTVLVGGVIDTAGVFGDYFVRRDYTFSFGDDSVGVYDFRGSVWMNRLFDVEGIVRPRVVRSAGVGERLFRPFVFGGFGDGLGFGVGGVELRCGLMVGVGGYGSSFGGGYLVGCGYRW